MKTLVSLLLLVAILIAAVVTIFQVNESIKYYKWIGKFGTVLVVDIQNPANCLFDQTCRLALDDNRVMLSKQYKYANVIYYLDPRWIKEGVTIEQIQTYIAEYPYP